MHIAGVPDFTIMAIGRWRSLGFMVYIQQQISSFDTGISVRMSQKPWFWHPLSIQSSTKPSKHPTHIFSNPGPVRWTERHHFSGRPTKTPSDHPSTSSSHFPTKIPFKSPSRCPFKISNQNSFQITQPGSI